MSSTRVKFGDVVINVNETLRDESEHSFSRVVGLEHIDSGDSELRRWDELSSLPEGTSFTRIFRRGHVLFGKRRAYQRKVAVASFDGICSSDILVFTPSDKRLNPGFLLYIVQSEGFFAHALQTSSGSLSPRTRWQDLASFEFELPSLDEQERILELLSVVDAHAEALRNQAKAAEDSRRVVLHELLTAGGEGWTETTLGELCELYQPVTISKAEMDDAAPYIVYGANGPVGRYSRFNHEEPEVVVTCRGATCGVVNMTPPNCWITGNAMVVKPRDNRSIKGFLFWALQTSIDVQAAISGSAQPQITRTGLAPSKILVPPVGKQKKIVDEISKIDALIQETNSALVATQQLRSALLNKEIS